MQIINLVMYYIPIPRNLYKRFLGPQDRQIIQ